MKVGGSLFLIALGAILTFAVTKKFSWVNLDTVGVILMLVGIAGGLLTVVEANTRRRTDVVYREDGATYIEPNDGADPRL